MKISNSNIDGGKAFDWGRTSKDYALYRDIYPEIFYNKIIEKNLCVKGQKVLDLGTGTGVIPRNMYKFGADWIGCDISANQIEQAKLLCEQSNMNIRFICSSAEYLDFPDNSFDVITACQCFWYFNYKIVAPKLYKMLNPKGKLIILYMAWLPFEDNIALNSEKLILKYNPTWTGGGETCHPIDIPSELNDYFNLKAHEEYKLDIPFSRETWNGRMKACRGVGASLSENEISAWEKEHLLMLEQFAPENFTIKHYCAYAILERCD